MTKVVAVIAISFDNGSVGRMQMLERPIIPVEFTGTQQAVVPEYPTDADIQAEIDKSGEAWKALGIAAIGWRRCTMEDFPVEHTDLRNAWTMNKKGKITVDMDKAKNITRQRLRAERAPLLAEQDIAALQALETGDQEALAAVVVEKQQLRDITKSPDIENAKTPDDLRAIVLTPVAVETEEITQ